MRGASSCAKSPVGGSSTTKTAGRSGRSLLAPAAAALARRACGARLPERGVSGAANGPGAPGCGVTGCGGEAGRGGLGALDRESAASGIGAGSGVMSSSPNCDTPPPLRPPVRASFATLKSTQISTGEAKGIALCGPRTKLPPYVILGVLESAPQAVKGDERRLAPHRSCHRWRERASWAFASLT
jgi:hypothetical protein